MGLGLVHRPLKPVQIVHIPLQQAQKKPGQRLFRREVSSLLLQNLPHNPLDTGLRRLAFTEEKKRLLGHIDQNFGRFGPVAVDVIPVKGQQIKIFKTLKALALPLVKIVQPLWVQIGRRLLHAVEGEYQMGHGKSLFS